MAFESIGVMAINQTMVRDSCGRLPCLLLKAIALAAARASVAAAVAGPQMRGSSMGSGPERGRSSGRSIATSSTGARALTHDENESQLEIISRCVC